MYQLSVHRCHLVLVSVTSLLCSSHYLFLLKFFLYLTLPLFAIIVIIFVYLILDEFVVVKPLKAICLVIGYVFQMAH